MANSTITVQQIVDDAASNGDIAPTLATGGFGDQPALRIADTVMAAMLLGGPNGQPYNWKWNRFLVTPFPTISWQQDYFVPGLVTLGWLENCWANEFNISSQPKPKIPMEVRKDLQATYQQTGYPAKICWLPNKLMLTGTWGSTELQTITGQDNPGPGVVYTNPIGATTQPANPITQITDPNGNFWVVTTFGTCGAVQPVWPTTIVYPTLTNPTAAATTVADGSVVWTAINPNGQGFRLSPIPPKQGQVWTINPIAQSRINLFTSLTQTIDPVPDDLYMYFRDGFFAQCYRRHPDPKIRAKFASEWQLWLKSLDDAVKRFDREMDDYGFYPQNAGVMETGWGSTWLGPAWPYNGWPGLY